MKYPGDILGSADIAGSPLRRVLILFAFSMTLVGFALPSRAQAQASATPVPVVLVTPTPEGQPAATPTDTATPIPTPLAAVRLRAIDRAGNVNIRALPSLDGEILGTITAGVEYQVLRNYYRWYEFRYEFSPSGRGWIYGDLVEIVGDSAQIVVIENPADIAAPGPIPDIEGSADSENQQRTLAIATGQADSELSLELVGVTALPTFTPPAATPASFTNQLESGRVDAAQLANVPPILPIAIFAALGLLGFLISAIRS